MGQITSLFVHKVIRQVDENLDKSALLAISGIDPAAPVDPGMMVDAADYYRFFEECARADRNGITLPLRVGASMRCEDYGAFGLAWKSAPCLRDSCERAARFARVLTSVATYEVRDDHEGVYMQLHREGDRTLGMRLSNEATIASIAAIAQEVSTDRFQPLAVYFRHEAPGKGDEHEQHFGCPVRFNSDMDAVLVPHDTMLKPNKTGESSFLKFFDTHLEQRLAELGSEDTLEHRARIQISQSLSQGIPKVSAIAEKLGMGARTLQRRLSESNHTYQGLVDEARRELAERLLQETEYPLAEVAFLAGFSEQSAFNRAFKRWAGQTPRSYRISAQSKADPA